MKFVMFSVIYSKGWDAEKHFIKTGPHAEPKDINDRNHYDSIDRKDRGRFARDPFILLL